MLNIVPGGASDSDARGWAFRLALARCALQSDASPSGRRDELLAVVNDLLRLAVERDRLGWRRSWRRVVAHRRRQLDLLAEQQLDVLCELCVHPGRPLRR